MKKKKKSIWKIQEKLLKSILCFVTIFTCIGFSPLINGDSSTVYAAETGEEQVSTWDDLIKAINNPSVTNIQLTKSIVRTGAAKNDLPNISRNLKISGNGYTLDFQKDATHAFVLARTGQLTKLTITDLKVTNIGCDYFIIHTDTSASIGDSGKYTENWEVSLNNINHVESQTPAAMFKAPNSDVVFTGNITWNTTNTKNYDGCTSTAGMIVSRGFTITNGANLNLKARYTIFNINPYSVDMNTFVRIDKGSKVDLYSTERQAMWINKERSKNNPVNFTITGAGTVVNAKGDGYGIGNESGIISVAGGRADQTNTSFIEISDGAQLYVNSTGVNRADGRSMSSFISQITNGNFNIKGNGTKVNLVSNGADCIYGATLLFRTPGTQSLNVSDQAELTVQKNKGVSTAAALIFYGQSNAFNVTSGGKAKVYNAGDGTPGDNDNEAIEYTAGGCTKQLFTVSGRGSEVELVADFGPAFSVCSTYTDISVNDQASFIAKGRTYTSCNGIFDATNLNFTMDNPSYYDFVNTRPGGGLIFEVCYKSTYKSNNSELSVWRAGDNINGNPYKSWDKLNFALSGEHYKTITSTSNPSQFNANANSFGSTGMKAYTRISGNNTNAYAIEAENIVLSVAQVEALINNNQLITLSKAKAWNTRNSNAATVGLESTNLVATKGDYTATFYVNEAQDTKITIKIKVIDKHVIGNGNQYTIGANNLLINIEMATAITDKNQLITMSLAEAFNRNDMSSGTIKLESTNLEVRKGDYTATFSVNEDPTAKVTIKIKVVPQDIVDAMQFLTKPTTLTTTSTGARDYAVGANHITITKKQAEKLTNADLITWADAEGWKLLDFSNAKVEVSDKNIGTDTTSTDYYVEFRVTDSPLTKVRVKVTVTN